jgi:hypothetical protein
MRFRPFFFLPWRFSAWSSRVSVTWERRQEVDAIHASNRRRRFAVREIRDSSRRFGKPTTLEMP